MAGISIAVWAWQVFWELKRPPTHETSEQIWANSFDLMKSIKAFGAWLGMLLILNRLGVIHDIIFLYIWWAMYSVCLFFHAYVIFYRRNGHLDQP